MKLIRLHHVQLELQASTRLWPRLWVLLLLSLLLRCCRFLPLAFCAGRCAVCEQFNLLSLHVLPFFPLCLRTLIETFGGQRCCHTHTHGGRQTMCAHYTQFYTFFLRLACTCNAALFNIKWRLIPGSTSSQSTHTHTDPFPPSLPQPGRSSAAAAAALVAATGAVCTSAGCRDEQR